MSTISSIRVLWVGFVTLLALVSISLTASAEPLADVKKAELLEVVRQFSEVTVESKFDEVISISMPPVMLDEIARPSGVSGETLKPLVVKQISSMMETIDLISFNMDTGSIVYETLEDGAQFARIPTTTLMKISGQTIRTESETLGIQDNNQWYLLRISDPKQMKLLRKIYPQFINVNIVKDKIVRVD